EELAFHRDARRDDLIGEGLSPEAAERQARIELGMTETHRQAYRKARGFAWLDRLGGDLRYGMRSLRQRPGFSLSVVLILGLAIAVNTVLFSIYSAYVLQPPRVAVADRLVDITLYSEDGRSRNWLEDEELQRLQPALDSVLQSSLARREFGVPVTTTITSNERKAMVFAQIVKPDFFRVLGARPAMGRVFAPGEGEVKGRDPLLVLSNSGWRSLTGADPDVVGKAMEINGQAYTVIGVMPPDFAGIDVILPTFWAPASMSDQLLGASGGMQPRPWVVTGVLAAGVQPEQVAARLTTALGNLDQSNEAGERFRDATVTRRTSRLDAGDAEAMKIAAWPIFAAFALVLLVACANLANLFLARATARRNELAIRLSLGASRGRVVSQLLTESLLLALAAAALACVITALAVEPVHRLVFGMVLRFGMDIGAVDADWRAFAYAALLAMLAAVTFGLIPALQATRGDLAGGVRRDGHAFGGRLPSHRLRGVLMTAQIASSLLLLVVAGLIVDNARLADDLDAGYDLERVVHLRYQSPDPALLQRLREEPGVREVAVVARAPLMGVLARQGVSIDGRTEVVGSMQTDEHYFDALDIALLDGRGFTRQEAEDGADVAVLSAATAARWFPGRSPLGAVLEIVPGRGDDSPPRHVRVIGVAPDVISQFFFQGPDHSLVYLPDASGGELLVAIDRPIGLMRQRLSDLCIDAGGYCDPNTFGDLVGIQRMPFAIASQVAVVLGALALLISCVGLYGVVSYLIARRTREIGVRIALGAQRGGVLRFVLGGALRQVLIGMAIALPLCLLLSFALSRLMPTLSLFGFNAYVLTPALLLGVALLATLRPAWRATAISPMRALREE
ncbi:MAG: ABC transporter permease, partial [Xanthomonadales bacterium]|nr:ABC transporter permease [Xanthomonadales bacterium]